MRTRARAATAARLGIDAYLRGYAAGGYPPDRVVPARCACGGDRFALQLVEDEGAARRACVACTAAHLMLDSAEYWDEGEPDEAACPCGTEIFELAVGFAHRDDRSIKWVSIGGRCVGCGILGVYADWKIDYQPADHLYDAV